MAYRPNPFGPVRDQAYPSEIAGQRPMMAPRIHCEERMNTDASMRGEHREEESYEPPKPEVESMSERFNRQLREGHGGRNSGDE